MLAKRIIPCLDVTGGRVVKGVNFINLRDAGDPVELADRYNQQGADEVVFLDITASSDERAIMADVVLRTARKVFIPLAVGGGIRSVADARRILLTSMDTDGVQQGFDCELTRAVSRATHIPVIASGGAGGPDDFVRVFSEGEADAALAASIFHYGAYTVSDLKEQLDRHGIPVRKSG